MKKKWPSFREKTNNNNNNNNNNAGNIDLWYVPVNCVTNIS